MDIARGASKRKIQNDTSEGESAPQPKRQRFSLRLSKGDSTQKSVEEQPEDTPSIVIQDSEDDKEDLYIPEPGVYLPASEKKSAVKTQTNFVDDGLVACPMCERRMKEWQVFKHIESCTGPTATPKRGESSRHSIKADTPNIPPNRLERLPALNYSILKEKGLRQKLAELGLPASGSRLTMESRHKEWMTLWNANCDAIKPKKRAELLRDLDTWERTQGAMALGRGQSGVMVKDKNFDAGAWAKEHDESFHDLIAQARKSRDEARRKAQQPDNKDKEKASDLKVDVKDDMHTGQNWVKPDEDMKDG